MKLERDVFLYNAYIAQKKYRIVIDEISEKSAVELRAIKLLAEFFAYPNKRYGDWWLCFIKSRFIFECWIFFSIIISIQGFYFAIIFWEIRQIWKWKPLHCNCWSHYVFKWWTSWESFASFVPWWPSGIVSWSVTFSTIRTRYNQI